MTENYPWDVLGLSGPADERSIKRSYARLVKRTRPDTDPEGFKALRAAYELAMNWAVDTGASTPPMLSGDEMTEAPPGADEPMALPPAMPYRLEMTAATHQVLHDSFVQDERDWNALAEAIEAVSGLEQAATPAPAAQDMPGMIRRLWALPAQQNLQTAQRTEELLIRLAAESEVWPTQAVQLVWEHYRLEDRLAFVPVWSDEHRIHHRLQGQAQWAALRAEVAHQPGLPEALLFRPLGRRDRLRYLFSHAVRQRSSEVLDWVRHQQPQYVAELHQPSVRWVDRQRQRMDRLPQWGLVRWLFAWACGTFGVMFLTPPEIAQELSTYSTSWLILGAVMAVTTWVLAAALKRWVLPAWHRADAARPRTFAALECASVGVVMACFAVGGGAPIAATTLAVLAIVVLLLCWATHERTSPLGPPAVDSWLVGLLSMLAGGLLLQWGTAAQPCWAIAPLAGAASLQREWPRPPWVVDELAAQYHWRSGQAFRWGMHAIHALLAVVLLVFVGLSVAPGLGYTPLEGMAESTTWAVLGVLLVYGVWLLVGWPPLSRVLSGSGLRGIGRLIAVVVFVSASMLLLRGPTGLDASSSMRVMLAVLLLIQLLRVSLHVRKAGRMAAPQA